MPGTVPARVRIYHITPIDNLPAILDAGALVCKRQATTQQDVSRAEIQQGRASKDVPDPPGGTIHDYVPFYFGERSPMLLALARHHKTAYRGTQEEIIYLVSAVDLIEKNQLEYVFSDGHTTMKITRMFNSVNDLDKVDWNVVNARQWNDVPGQHNDRKRRKQAEFLVKGQVPLELLLGFAVRTEAMKQRLRALLSTYPAYAEAYIAVRPEWYYEEYA